jgi:signal transduction histidine kinase
LVSEDERADELLSVATASVTGLLLHEFSPLLGDIRRRARSDVPDYETSQTMQAIDRLDRLLEAIRSLNRAASAAKMADLDVSTVVQSLAQECAERGEVRIESSGPRPLLVRGDPGLIEMAVGQGIRNAAESLPAEATFPIQVTWDLVDGTASISVSDRGVGLPKGFDSTLRSIATTKDKREHHGFGLLTANRAVRSMGGRLSVARRDGGGTTFTLEWPAV